MTTTTKTNEAIVAQEPQNTALAQVSAETQAFELIQRQAMMLLTVMRWSSVMRGSTAMRGSSARNWNELKRTRS
jgi:hypothetical protein